MGVQKVRIKWLGNARRRPVPNPYHATLSIENPPVQLWSCSLMFEDNTREVADVSCWFFDPPDLFYITEGNRVVAEAHKING